MISHAEHPEIVSLGVVIDALTAAGCRPVTLGPRILRTETAGLATLSALMCLYGEMA